MSDAGLIPPRYKNAATEVGEVLRWCEDVLAGRHARLLLLGPTFSGKTYTGFAALRRLLAADYPARRVAVYAHDLVDRYEPSLITNGPPVLFVDDLTFYVTLRHHISSLPDAEVDEPYDQAVIAVQAASLANATTQLAFHTADSWIATASSREHLVEVVGDQVTTQLLASTYVVDLPARPVPKFTS